MRHDDVSYSPLSNHTEVPKLPKCCSLRRMLACLFIGIVSLLILVVTCYNHSNFCPQHKLHIKHTKRRLPHCLIIGARKAGTRALLTFLRLHPDIQTAQYETHFFDNVDNYDFGYEWYRKQMPYSFRDQLTLEKTPAYFTEFPVPFRVYKMNSTIKLILIVRDPIERCISDHLQLSVQRRTMGLHEEKFEDVVMNKSTGEINQKFKPVARSFFDVYMKNWLKYFPLDQFHIVDGNKLIKDPYPQVYKLESFLGVRHAISQETFVFNQTKGFYCINTETRKRCLSDTKGRKHPKVDPIVIDKLKDVFWDHNVRFYKLVKKTFDWNN